MKNLIVCRHANYDCKTGFVTDFGYKQIGKLADYLKNQKDFEIGRYDYFASSKSTRATETARELIKGLDIKMGMAHSWPELFDGEEFLTLDKAKSIHKRVKRLTSMAETLVLVSHFSVATGYSTYFMQERFGDIMGIDNVPKGKAVLIDIKNKDYDIIPK
tara:strand:- start:87 stop:566 length:480 start_codon:yes stop_codon:yes gene_type:complete